MKKTNLKFYDRSDKKVRTVYSKLVTYHGWCGDTTYPAYYIRRGNKYETAGALHIFNPNKRPQFNRANVVKMLRSKIEHREAYLEAVRDDRDRTSFNRTVGEIDTLEDILEYIMKMQEE